MEALATMGCDDTLSLPVEGTDEDGNTVTATVMVSARVDPDGGGLRWVQEEDVAAAVRSAMGASQMASMLHDSGRVEAFARAIDGAVGRFRAEHGRGPVVLDVGAGTGLLSLIAAKAGAAAVFACEMYGPMAAVAREVVAANGEAGRVSVLAMASTALSVGDASPDDVAAAVASGAAPAWGGVDLPCRCELLVTEILDSALLGEGMVPATRDAWERLLVPSAAVVPEAARLLVTLASCPAVAATRDADAVMWSGGGGEGGKAGAVERGSGEGGKAGAVEGGGGTGMGGAEAAAAGVRLRRTDWSEEPCPGGARVLPLHTLRLRMGRLTGAVQAATWRFDRPGRALDGADDVITAAVPGAGAGAGGAAKADCAVMWWEVLVGRDGAGARVVYNTRPSHEAWEGELAVSQPGGARGWPGTAAPCEEVWQDHWTPCVQPLPRPLGPAAGPRGALLGLHVTDTSLWVEAAELTGDTAEAASAAEPSPKRPRGGHAWSDGPPQCVCGLHSVLQPDRTAQLADAGRNLALAAAVGRAAARGRRRVVSTGEDGWTAVLAAAAAPGSRVVAVIPSPLASVHVAKAAAGSAVTVLQATAETIAAEPAALEAAFAELEGGGEGGAPAPAGGTPAGPVDAVVSDGFFAQCLQRPVWQALVHWQACRALHAARLLPGRAAVVPAVVYVRCAAVALPQLRPSFRPVAGTVRGLDHAAFDAERAGWEAARTLSFPLWMYETAVVSAVATPFALRCYAGDDGSGPAVAAGPGLRPCAADEAACDLAPLLGALTAEADAVAVWTESDLSGASWGEEGPTAAPAWGPGDHPAGWVSTAWAGPGGSPVLWARQEVRVLGRPAAAGGSVALTCSLDSREGRGVVFA